MGQEVSPADVASRKTRKQRSLISLIGWRVLRGGEFLGWGENPCNGSLCAGEKPLSPICNS